jgi:hypothetical protein
MTLEKYIVYERVDLGEGGKSAGFEYQDLFDPKEFMDIVMNPEEPSIKRIRCARRLINANVISSDDLKKLVSENSH